MSLGGWWSKLRAAPDAALAEQLETQERKAEAAYDAMYAARRPQDCYEDAMLHFERAIDAARRLGRFREVERLNRRREHIYNVYTHQYRGV